MSHSPNPPHPHQTQAHTTTDQPSATPSTNSQTDILQQLIAAIGPVLEFHKAVEQASDNDLRLYWDIRLVRGKDTPFTSISGHSSFPGTLANISVGQLPSMLSREIVEKIAVPLAARVQELTSDTALKSVVKHISRQEDPPPAPALPAASPEQHLLPDDAKNSVVDALLPKSALAEAELIMEELQKHE